ncbi:MAG: hypothetical protein VW964_10005, partial [Ilumatobacter sp.]
MDRDVEAIGEPGMSGSRPEPADDEHDRHGDRSKESRAADAPIGGQEQCGGAGSLQQPREEQQTADPLHVRCLETDVGVGTDLSEEGVV